jgi:hypothetical protein
LALALKLNVPVHVPEIAMPTVAVLGCRGRITASPFVVILPPQIPVAPHDAPCPMAFLGIMPNARAAIRNTFRRELTFQFMTIASMPG